MVDVLCLGGEGDDQSVDGPGGKVFAVGDFLFVALPALSYDDIVALALGDGFDAIDDLGEEIIIDVANDDAYGPAMAFFQALSDGVGFIIMFPGIFEDGLLGFFSYLMAAPQRF
jgi:hypothetical protein